jgi:hypothetical protein
MQSLIAKARLAYEAASGTRVEPSIPILYFGDCDAFCKSRLRIVTVGLNPGSRAFPKSTSKRWSFFPAYERSGSYQEAWNQYFQTDAARKEPWFTNLDCILHGFHASFYNAMQPQNTALHTDMLSPIATEVPWSDLGKRDQEQLAEAGVPLWNELINLLKPHILIISIAEKHRESIRFERVQGWRTLLTLNKAKTGKPRRKPYLVTHSVMQLSRDFRADVVFGRAAQMPFGVLSNVDKKSIGAKLKGRLENW